jgi:hypothetical protein
MNEACLYNARMHGIRVDALSVAGLAQLEHHAGQERLGGCIVDGAAAVKGRR